LGIVVQTNQQLEEIDGAKLPEKRQRWWPGMPTRETKMVEVFLGFFPGWIAIVGILVALLLPLIQSCRQMIE
jgi:hypothetical protein